RARRGEGGRLRCEPERLRPDARRDRLRLGDRRLHWDHGAGAGAARARGGPSLAVLPPERARRLRERAARDLARDPRAQSRAWLRWVEELEAARPRGAKVYAEVLGYGASNDAYHMAAPEPAAIGVGEMMRAALERAGIEPKRVGYINAHGTSTPLGDAAETKA